MSGTDRTGDSGLGDLLGSLRDDIVSGRLPPGAQLPGERALAGEHGVSRPAVREALRTLSAQGLIVVRPARGAFVRGPEVQDVAEPFGRIMDAERATVRDVAAARIILEAATARMVAERTVDLDDLQRLAEIIDSGDDLLEQARHDLMFHFLLCRQSGNPVVYAMYRAIGPSVLGMMLRRRSQPEADDETWVWHWQITEVIGRGDVDDAERLMRAHLRATRAAFGPHYDRPAVEVAREDLRHLIGSLMTFEEFTASVFTEVDVSAGGSAMP